MPPPINPVRDVAAFGPAGFFYEGLRWHGGRWWASDMYGGEVLSLDAEGSARVEARLADDRPSGLGWLPDGSLLIVAMVGRRLLRRAPATGMLEVHADLAPFCGEADGFLNDMLVDARGRAFVGFDRDLAGPRRTYGDLLCVHPDARAEVVVRDLRFPNGMVIDAGGRLIVAETLGERLSTVDIGEDGALSTVESWADLSALDCGTVPAGRIMPDGIAIDAEDHVWVADALAGCWRVGRGGTIADGVALPDGLFAFACALGGADGRTLLIAAADKNHAVRGARRDARLFTTRVTVPAPDAAA